MQNLRETGEIGTKCISEGCTNDRASNKRRCNLCRSLQSKYGITTPERDTLLNEQENQCKICKHPIKFIGKPAAGSRYAAVVDHQVMPFKVRGILCSACNTALGKLGDNVEGLERALNYVKGKL